MLASATPAGSLGPETCRPEALSPTCLWGCHLPNSKANCCFDLQLSAATGVLSSRHWAQPTILPSSAHATQELSAGAWPHFPFLAYQSPETAKYTFGVENYSESYKLYWDKNAFVHKYSS